MPAKKKRTSKPVNMAAQVAATRQYRIGKRDKSTKRPKSSAPVTDANFAAPPADDPEAWLLAYLPRAYPLPFGDVHREVISAVVYALNSGTNVAVAAPRGTGKSTLLNGLALWALLTGRVRFPVVLPWADKARKQALRFWANELCFNTRILRDYRETVEIFHRCKGIAQRLASLTENGEGTGARLGVTEGIIVLPHGAGAIGSATINGNPRGLNYSTQTGEIRRPSLAIIDDPQDRDTAQSPARVRDTIDRIDADVAGMAGPDERMPRLLSCTVIARDDVAEHYLAHPDWHAIRTGQVTAWPVGWDDADSACRKLWTEWDEIRKQGDAAKDGGVAAVAFYLSNRETLTAGMTVSWAERYDRKRGQPDALYSAMLDFHTMGEAAFMAERQNAPLTREATIYDLTPAVVASRVDAGRPVYVAPNWARIITVATDINHYGLHTVATAFGNDHTAAVMWYGRHDNGGRGIVPKNANEADRKRLIYEALVTHGRQLAGARFVRDGKPAAVGVWLVDGGYEHETVQRYIQTHGRTLGFPAMVSRGYGYDKYRPYGKNVIGQAREFCHLTEWPQGRGIAYHADYWREVSQRAWLGSVGAPGSCSLFESPHGHAEFAEHVTRERLIEKLDGKAGVVWRWAIAPGWHDFGDALYMTYVAACWCGIGTSGVRVQRRYVETRKARPVEGIV